MTTLTLDRASIKPGTAYAVLVLSYAVIALKQFYIAIGLNSNIDFLRRMQKLSCEVTRTINVTELDLQHYEEALDIFGYICPRKLDGFGWGMGERVVL